MAFHWISTLEKPFLKLAMSDWQERTDCLRNVSHARRADAFELHNSLRLLHNESSSECKWANYASNEALDKRIGETSLWHEVTAREFDRLQIEISALREERRAAEDELERQAGPIATLAEVLVVRDGLLPSELTADQPRIQLRNELYLLENNQRQLADIIQKTWAKLRHLEAVRIKVDQELKNKLEAADIDRAQRALDRNSNSISYKPDALRNPKNCCSYETWLNHSRAIKIMVESERLDAAALRESLYVCRLKSRSLLEAQQARTDDLLRSRIFQTQLVCNELNWQQTRLQEELGKSTCEIELITALLHDRANDLRLVETRLESRAQRSEPELCLDDAHTALCLEADKLREIRVCLENKLIEAKANLNLLSIHLKNVAEDLDKKQHSLITDNRALELHQRFHDGEPVPKTQNPSPQTDRNIELLNAGDIVSPES